MRLRFVESKMVYNGINPPNGSKRRKRMNVNQPETKNVGLAFEIRRNDFISDDKSIEFCYRLVELRVPDQIFLIEIKSPSGDRAVFAENDEKTAVKLYECFFRGGVGPGSSRDLFRDILTDNLV